MFTDICIFCANGSGRLLQIFTFETSFRLLLYDWIHLLCLIFDAITTFVTPDNLAAWIPELHEKPFGIKDAQD